MLLYPIRIDQIKSVGLAIMSLRAWGLALMLL